jgi:transcriptional regulator with XRE-family HTH domain
MEGQQMNQLKIGKFLKQLRTEKNLTQEQLAESLNVSRRTVSRWETGFNLPDLDILVIMSDFYQVDLRELLDGERRNERMDEELKDTVMKVAQYSNEEKRRASRVVLVFFVLGIVSLFANVIMRMMDISESFMYGFADGATIGMAIGSMVLGILYVTGAMMKVQAFKKRILGCGR